MFAQIEAAQFNSALGRLESLLDKPLVIVLAGAVVLYLFRYRLGLAKPPATDRGPRHRASRPRDYDALRPADGYRSAAAEPPRGEEIPVELPPAPSFNLGQVRDVKQYMAQLETEQQRCKKFLASVAAEATVAPATPAP